MRKFVSYFVFDPCDRNFIFVFKLGKLEVLAALTLALT